MNVSAPPIRPEPSPLFPKKRLLEILELVSAVPVVWSTARRGFLALRPGSAEAWLIAFVQSYVEVGVDERRQRFDPALGRNVTVAGGQRQFTLVLRAQSLDENAEAFDVLERIRFRFRSLAVRELMVPTIALRDFGPITTLPESTYPVGENVERALLEATMDVRMACVVQSDPEDPGENNFIETVTVMPASPGTALSGTVALESGALQISFSVPQTLAAGDPIVFSSQPGVAYLLAENTTSSTSATLTAPYTGPSEAAATAVLGNLLP